MPIVIMPKRSKMDKMGGGGMDIGRTTPSPSKYAIPGIEKNPTLKKKKMNKMAGKMEDMREYLDVLDGIEEEMHSEDTVQESYYKDMMQDVEEGMTKEEFAKKYPGSKDEYDKIKKEIADMNESQVDQDTVEENYLRYFMGKPAMYKMFSDVDKGMSEEEFNKKYPRSKGEYAKIKKEIADMSESQVNEGSMKQATIEVEDWAEKYNQYTGANGDDLANGYLQAMLNTGITSDAYDQDEYLAFNKKNGYENDGDWQEGDMEKFMMSSPITKGMFDEIEAIQNKYGIDEEGVNDIMGYFDKMENRDIEDRNESQIDEGRFKQAQIELQDWADKYNKTEGTNGDKLADGYFQAMTNTGIVSDAYDADEVMAFNKMKGYPTNEIDQSWEDGDHEDFTTNKSGVSPITGGMFTEINQILSKYNLDVDDASDMYEEKNMENKEIEVEEDCGCEQEAVDQMVTMPMQELADILQLAGYKNYEEKIAEYANEPAENYMDPEEQLIGLSGGLNRPKKSYPASAPGDNPMDQEPREIEETVEQQLYKSYKDFLEAEEIKEKD